MSATAKFVVQRFYRVADGDPVRLPWHCSEPPEILRAASGEIEAGAAAPDIGWGAGAFSVWLSERGLRVTGLDLLPKAIAMAQARTSEKGVDVEFIGGDLFAYAPNRTFDLIVDSGYLHSLIGGSVAAYRQRILDHVRCTGSRTRRAS